MGGVGGNQSLARTRRAGCAREEEKACASRGRGAGSRSLLWWARWPECRGRDEPEPLPAAWLSAAALAFHTVCSGCAPRGWRGAGSEGGEPGAAALHRAGGSSISRCVLAAAAGRRVQKLGEGCVGAGTFVSGHAERGMGELVAGGVCASKGQGAAFFLVAPQRASMFAQVSAEEQLVAGSSARWPLAGPAPKSAVPRYAQARRAA